MHSSLKFNKLAMEIKEEIQALWAGPSSRTALQKSLRKPKIEIMRKAGRLANRRPVFLNTNIQRFRLLA